MLSSNLWIIGRNSAKGMDWVTFCDKQGRLGVPIFTWSQAAFRFAAEIGGPCEIIELKRVEAAKWLRDNLLERQVANIYVDPVYGSKETVVVPLLDYLISIE